MNTTLDNITSAFNTLSRKMTTHDFLFLFWVGHGVSPPEHSFLIDYHNTITISFKKIAELVDNITAKRMVLAFHPCFSGGIISYLSRENRVILTSTKYVEEDNGWGELFRDGLLGYGDLPNPDGDPYTTDSHGNGDGFVSFEEAYYYAAYRAYNELSTHQHALLEDNPDNGYSGSWYGDESYNPHEESSDGYLAAHTYL
ncbi:Peptidase C13 family [Aciduliprofundum sp. MAR08-339]|uniref:caspase family protein n=1 Tax=Aciduliprofundum sp. (strain MAR08-339) TaxID=673860 RepID=UPI0002A4B357|nr:Peptidase C13 family [Aciduliprofundum sp. MAR08-339]